MLRRAPWDAQQNAPCERSSRLVFLRYRLEHCSAESEKFSASCDSSLNNARENLLLCGRDERLRLVNMRPGTPNSDWQISRSRSIEISRRRISKSKDRENFPVMDWVQLVVPTRSRLTAINSDRQISRSRSIEISSRHVFANTHHGNF